MNQPRATLAAGMQVTPSVRLLSPLGAGGMGAVWLADHTALNTRVVVKFMLVGLDSSVSARARFKKEAEAASQVKSPHVVQTFDYGVTSQGLPFIVMEHLEGRDLAAEIAAVGPLEPGRVVAIVTQVAKALSKAHAAGLLHRDIKPDNIFLCHTEAEDELFVKLLDFGIAKLHAPGGEAELDGQTKTGQVIGTPFYMSPEQVTAQKVIDLRSDLWSLGIVAFEALTGKRPFDGPSFGALAVKIATTNAPKPSDENPSLPPSVDAWFAQACAREVAGRFPSARELASRLRAAFDGVVSLPPIASGMTDTGPNPSDSGSRPTKAAASKPSSGDGEDPGVAATAVDSRVPSAPSSNPRSAGPPMSSVPPGPISIDDDARERPSFVLASTASEANIGDRSVLARSDGGASVAITGDNDAAPTGGRAPSPKMKALVLVGLVSLIAVGIAAGRMTKGAEGTAPTQGTTEKNAGSAALTALPTTAPPPPSTAPTAPASTASLASAIPSATAADAGTHASPGTSAPVAAIPTRAGTVGHGRPVGSGASAAASKATNTGPPASARPLPTSHDDPLF